MSFRPSRSDLAERPNRPEHLLRGFHGRPLKNRHRFYMPDYNLSAAECLGRSETIFYLSDKRDPNDPEGEGAQGILKRFYHDQGPASYLYVISQNLDPFEENLVECALRSGMTGEAKRKGLYPKGGFPSTVVELGVLEKVMLVCAREDVEISFHNYGLYVWDNMQTLMGISKEENSPSKVYLWSSHDTHVNWRGIID